MSIFLLILFVFVVLWFLFNVHDIRNLRFVFVPKQRKRESELETMMEKFNLRDDLCFVLFCFSEKKFYWKYNIQTKEVNYSIDKLHLIEKRRTVREKITSDFGRHVLQRPCTYQMIVGKEMTKS